MTSEPDANVRASPTQVLDCERSAEVTLAPLFGRVTVRASRSGARFAMTHEAWPLPGAGLCRQTFAAQTSYRPPPASPFVAVTLALAGSLQAHSGGTVHDVSVGSVLMSEPGRTKDLEWSPGGDFLTVRVDRATLQRHAEAMGLSRPVFEPMLQPGRSATLWAHAAGALLDVLRTGLPVPSAVLRAHRDLLLTTLVAEMADAAPRAEDDDPAALGRAEALIARRYAEPLSLCDLTAAAGLGPSALAAAFKRHRGTSPMRALREHRLERARAALRSGDDSVTDVAHAVGFPHPGRFAEAYAARYGEAPSVTLRKGAQGTG